MSAPDSAVASGKMGKHRGIGEWSAELELTRTYIDGTDAVVEAKSLDRRVDMQLQNLNALAGWLTRTLVRADCFFVTSARLLGTTIEDISRRAGLAVPPPGSGGISLSNMVAGLERLGLRFRVWTFHDEDGGPSRTPRGVPESQAYAPVGAPRVMGVAYRRPDGSGHVVIVR